MRFQVCRTQAGRVNKSPFRGDVRLPRARGRTMLHRCRHTAALSSMSASVLNAEFALLRGRRTHGEDGANF